MVCYNLCAYVIFDTSLAITHLTLQQGVCVCVCVPKAPTAILESYQRYIAHPLKKILYISHCPPTLYCAQF